jgi:hypothetical protein
MKCKERYVENSKVGELADDDVEHEGDRIDTDEFGMSWRVCTHCKGKIYKKF